MTIPAIALMVVTILLVWGGLVASIVALHTLPVPGDPQDASAGASATHDADAEALFTPRSSPGKE